MYHYGITIREYREKARMTQQQLADRWPKSERFGGGEGVSLNYIQDIEHGRKRIDDQQTLRKICVFLSIPLWKMGLGEYDPFTDALTGKSTYAKTFELIDFTLRQIWILRKASFLWQARQAITQLGNIFTYFQTDDTPPLQLEARYLHLFADYQCVNGVLAVDAMQYDQALCYYQHMYDIAKELDDPALIAHSLMNLGVEHDRKKNYGQSVQYLEEARDYSFETSKAWSVIIHSYLSRAYASVGDSFHFYRANDTARRLSTYLAPDFIQDKDEVYYTTGSIMAERSGGYLALGEPQKTLELRAEITSQLALDKDSRLQGWLYLDYAKAYKMMGEIEKAIAELREFYLHSKEMESSHALSHVTAMLVHLDEEGHGGVQAVKDFREELAEAH